MKIARTWLIAAAFLAVAIAVGIWLYPQMPARVATHFDAHGNPDGFSPRWMAAAFPGIVQLGLIGMTWLLPVLSPRKFEIHSFEKVFRGLMLAIQAVLLVVTVCAALKGAGFAVPFITVGTLALGVLFMVLGNYMGKLRKNFYIGIRTPWTLASSTVWERTHRVGGVLFVLAGLVWVIDALVGVNQTVLLTAIVAAAAVSLVYSYVIYKRLQRRGQLEG